MNEHPKMPSHLTQKHKVSTERVYNLIQKIPLKIQLNSLLFMITNKKIHLFDDTLPHQSTYVMTTQKLKDKIQLNYNRSCDMLKIQKKYHAENMLSNSLLNKVSLFFLKR